ncbi:hypothetical protein DFH09DRAFT_1096780 [Mycena vulgaris]|nr:hypothetical protein DFH09DRAFT_1096780 [Mycena vulgaris]
MTQLSLSSTSQASVPSPTSATVQEICWNAGAGTDSESSTARSAYPVLLSPSFQREAHLHVLRTLRSVSSNLAREYLNTTQFNEGDPACEWIGLVIVHTGARMETLPAAEYVPTYQIPQLFKWSGYWLESKRGNDRGAVNDGQQTARIYAALIHLTDSPTSLSPAGLDASVHIRSRKHRSSTSRNTRPIPSLALSAIRIRRAETNSARAGPAEATRPVSARPLNFDVHPSHLCTREVSMRARCEKRCSD